MLLAIDTCGVSGGVALAIPASNESGEATLHGPDFRFLELAGRTYSERLIPAISELLGRAAISLPELAGIVVVHGPGSFTGIRIGVSAAKGLAQALGIPLIALSRLELLAGRGPGAGAVAILDAGRGEFFAGIYRRDAGGLVCEAEMLTTPAELAQAVSGLPRVVCEQKVFEALAELGVTMAAAPTAVDALRAGLKRFETGSFDDTATLDANYLRRSETEMLARIAEHAATRAATAGGRE